MGRLVMAAAHVMRSISEVVETKAGRGRTTDRSRGHGLGKRLSELLRDAIGQWRLERGGEVADFAGEAETIAEPSSAGPSGA